jgi:hypothetical protein
LIAFLSGAADNLTANCDAGADKPPPGWRTLGGAAGGMAGDVTPTCTVTLARCLLECEKNVSPLPEALAITVSPARAQ